MRLLLIGIVIVALFVGVIFGTYTLLQHYDPLGQSQSSGNVVATPALPPWMKPTAQPIADTPIPPTPVPMIAPTATPNIPLSINVTTNKPQYRAGDALVLTASANQPCYLLVYDIEPDGSVGRRFPNSSVGESQIFPAEQRRIPEDDGEFALQMEGPAGSGYIHAVCSWKPVQGMFEVYQTLETFTAALQQQVYTHPAGQWVEMKIPYQIIR